MTKKIIPLPFPIYFWAMVSILVLGFLDSIYLSISHYRVYVDIGYKSFCAVSKAINCDTVSQSPYSIFLNFPVAVWGMIGYLFFLCFMLLALSESAEKKRLWALLQLISFVFSAFSIFLALISSYYLHSYCIMCIVTYGVNFLLLFYSWIIRKRFAPEEAFFKSLELDIRFLFYLERKMVFSIFIPFLVAVGLIWFFYPNYWDFKPPPLRNDLSTGITKDMHPWIGAEDPKLVIKEFTDYQCFQCKKMHYYLRQLVSEYPDKIRLIHAHYPMDSNFNPIVTTPFHEGSGNLALIAIHALLKNKFWAVNDVLFKLDIEKRGGINSKDFKNIAGLDNNELFLVLTNLNNRSNDYINNLHSILQYNIREGMKAGVTGTPGYLINDILYQGVIPPKIIKDVLK